ncbi:pannexin-1-like [Astyanax mexicanus]|uniref:Pannexin n=2 Tax=Astyanax mexicanus TaxID=7994 RepID=A0A8B9R9Z9_ASTMX|nr:pannexin-1-like [Astyanax mexicanus]
MAIAHVATEYVFSDFLLKEQTESKYKGVRLDLAADKLVTFIAVGLPLLLISLAFAQEVSVGSQISCFPPTNFSLRQAAYVDSFCWVAVESQSTEDGSPLWLHKFFPYILLLLAVLVYVPALFWRFTAVPQLSSDLSFIMEELDRCYNRSIRLAKSLAASSPSGKDIAEDPHSGLEIAEGCFKYPLVEQYLRTKRGTWTLAWKYLLCRILTLLTLLLASIYLAYYICVVSLTDQFSCYIHTGVRSAGGLVNDSTPPSVQCKLVAVGVFRLLSTINVCVYLLLIPAVIHSALSPARPHQHDCLLRPYRLLPTFGHAKGLQLATRRYDDLSIYLLFLKENLSELKSYKCLQVLELLTERESESLDTMCLLRTLGQVRTDLVDKKLTPIIDGNNESPPVKVEVDISKPKDVSPVLLKDGQQKEADCGCGKDVRQRMV